MLTLYQFGNSVCSQKVRITLAEKRLDWEAREVNLFKNEQYDPAYLELNPKAVVPTLVHDGTAVIESTLICEYLDDAFPEPALIPAAALARAQMRLWSKAIDEGLHEGVVEMSFSAMFRERMKNQSPEEREIRYRNVGDPRRRDRFVSTFELGVDSPYVYRGIAAYEKAFKTAEAALSDGRDWLIGAEYSLADINLAPYAARLEYLGLLDIWVAGRAGVQDWWRRVKARPSFERAIAGPLSDQEIDDMGASGAKIKTRIKEIHAEYLRQL